VLLFEFASFQYGKSSAWFELWWLALVAERFRSSAYRTSTSTLTGPAGTPKAFKNVEQQNFFCIPVLALLQIPHIRQIVAE
jgi:hypothetical protein